MSLFKKIFGFRESKKTGDIDRSAMGEEGIVDRANLIKGPKLDGPAIEEEPECGALTASLFEAIKQADIVQVKDLLDKGASVKPKPDWEVYRVFSTPLICAAGIGSSEIVELLIKHGADVNFADTYTALCYAALGGRLNVIKTLLNYGAEINYQNLSGATPLSQAVGGGNYDTAQFLLENGANVNIAEKSGETPLDIAYKHKHDDIIELLEKHGGKRGV